MANDASVRIGADDFIEVRKDAWDPRLLPVGGWVLAVHEIETGSRVGTVLLRVGTDDAIESWCGHVAYEVLPEYRSRGYAARACRLLAPLAREHGLQFVWIVMSPDNAASVRTAERAGAHYVDTVDVPIDSDVWRQGTTRVHRFRLDWRTA